MKKYKRIYIEVTNSCNLSCPFCAKTKRLKEFISIDNFKTILSKVESYTDYLYFHILGEPLLHPNINELIDIGSNKFKINITTNGYLIKNIKDNKNIRQLNISLHSFNEKYNKTLEEYLDDIFEVTDKLKDQTFISFRIWVNSKYTEKIIKKINEKYNSNIDYKNIENNSSIAKNIFISTHEEFIWPAVNETAINKEGTCYALKDQIGILVDGRIVPCCLDSEGEITLGNIFEDDIRDVIKSERYQRMLNGFKNHQKYEPLCQRCSFIKK